MRLCRALYRPAAAEVRSMLYKIKLDNMARSRSVTQVASADPRCWSSSQQQLVVQEEYLVDRELRNVISSRKGSISAAVEQ